MRITLGPLWLRVVYWTVVGFVIVVLSTSLTTSGAKQPMVTNWPVGTLSTVLFALAFGGLLAVATQKNSAPYLAAVKGLTAEQRSAVIGLVYRGPVPLDTKVHAAAVQLGTVYLAQSALYRRRNLLVLGLFVVGAAVLVLTDLRGDGQGLAFHVALLILFPLAGWWSEYQLRRIETQHATLADAQAARG